MPTLKTNASAASWSLMLTELRILPLSFIAFNDCAVWLNSLNSFFYSDSIYRVSHLTRWISGLSHLDLDLHWDTEFRLRRAVMCRLPR